MKYLSNDHNGLVERRKLMPSCLEHHATSALKPFLLRNWSSAVESMFPEQSKWLHYFSTMGCSQTIKNTFFAQSVQGMESRCIIWFLLMGIRRRIISQELSRKQMEDAQIGKGKHCTVCPSCWCSLQSELHRWFLMNCGAIWYGLHSGKGTAPQPLWATEKTFLCSPAPVQT